ncbi:GNAT family N-acetyltransferase [Paraburkholderia phosphatilytica]|uniref:GNAT family N-acetyltransferase n=1 Tax=Paraburkholderia phosphatilytica TaxID=2282883 RepID=UPI00197D946E|nr:GNAT family N-acetyltransferase [Paraburkholderia phosphatilytica]
MKRLRITDQLDLGVYYDADASYYEASGIHAQTVFTKEKFIAHYRNCRSIGFAYDDTPIGGVIYYRGYVHIAVLPDYHGRWAWLWEAALEWLFSFEQAALALVDAGNRPCLELMRRNGWSPVSHVDGSVIFRITREGRTCRARSRGRAVDLNGGTEAEAQVRT